MVAMVDKIPTIEVFPKKGKGLTARLSRLSCSRRRLIIYDMTLPSSLSLLHHNHQHTPPSMSSSRHLRKYSSPALTPSPLRRKSFVPPDSDLDGDSDLDAQPIEPDDLFRRSSTCSTKSLRNNFGLDSQPARSPLTTGKSTIPPAPFEDDEGLFLSTGAASSRSQTKDISRPSNSRAKQAMITPSRPPAPTTLPSSRTCTTPIRAQATSTPSIKSSAPHKIPAPSGTVGVKRKPTPLPVTAPYPKRGMTPLCVTKAAGNGSFGRLAPLPAPKFRGERSNGEADGLLRTESVTLACLRIDKEESDAILGDEEEAVDVSPGGHITKRLARSRPVSQELIDSTAATTGSHVSHNSCRVEAFVLFCLSQMSSSHYFMRTLPQSQSAGQLPPASPFPQHALVLHPHHHRLWPPPKPDSA